MTVPPTTNTLQRLEKWFAAQCDGEWEHGEGIVVESLDNPGWMIDVSLVDTPLAKKPFVKVERRYESDTEWITCDVQDGKFSGACGPGQLEEMIEVFLTWAEQP